ncbi:MAG TPA: hypothetical protein VGQ19_16870, partial [Burkholderiales bacterium]|nr:hypothetical protein [Burkholderiales bacterium]
TALKHYANDMVPLFTYRDVAPFRNGWNGFVLAATDGYLAKNRKTAVQFVRGCLDAVQSIHQNPQQGIRLYVEATGNKNALNMEKANDVPPDARILIPELQSEMDLMVQFGYSKTKASAAQLVDHSLLDEAARVR